MCDWAKSHRLNIAGGFWIASAAVLAFSGHLGGNMNEIVGGRVILAGEIVAATLGKKWKPACSLTMATYMAGSFIQRWPEFSSHLYLPVMMLGMLALNLPVIFEASLEKKAQIMLAEFRAAGRSVLGRTKDVMKKTALRICANPRKTAFDTNLLYLGSGLGMACAEVCARNDYKSLCYLAPFYVLAAIGNRIARTSKSSDSAPIPV